MTAPVSLGFLQPRADRIATGPWLLSAAGTDEVEDPHSLPDWDYSTLVRVERRLYVDVQGVLDDCGLREDSELRAVLTWHSTWTGLRGAGAAIRITDGGNVLQVAVPGELLGGQLNLEVRLVLGRKAHRIDELAPLRPGSTLWSDSTRVRLEGSGTRFPVVPVPFSQTGLAGGRRGLWCLSLEASDLADSALGSIRLYLNSEHQAVQRLLEVPDSPESQMLAAYLQFDVTRQLVLYTLRNEDLLLDVAYDAGSVGDLMSSLLVRLYPDRDLGTVRGDWRTNPGEFESELQARAGLLS